MAEGSRMQYYLRAIAEIEECASQYNEGEITVSPDVPQSLPPAVQSMLSRLESSGSDDPVRELSWRDLQGPGFGDLFGGKIDTDLEEKFGQKLKECAAGVRLLVLRAAGICKTLEVMDVSLLNLTILEMKVLLEPLQSSSVLREFNFGKGAWVERESGWKVVGDFLKFNRSVKVIHIGEIERRTAIPSIMRYLAAYGHPTLEILYLKHHSYDKEEVMDMIHACPNLQAMPGAYWQVKDEETAKFYAQGLMEQKSLCRIHLVGPSGPVSSLLLSACTGARSANSLAGLEVELTHTDRWLRKNVLLSTILANKNLEIISLHALRIVSEEWQGIFQSLKQNAVLKVFQLWKQRFDEDGGFDARAWAGMIAMLEECSHLENLTIFKSGNYQHDLRALIDAVTSSRQILKFKLYGFDLNAAEDKALITLITKNTSLTRLKLEMLRGRNWEKLFNSLRYNTTIKRLGLMLSSTFDDRALCALLAALQMNSVLEKIQLDGTVWKDEKKNEIVRYALQEEERQGAVTYAFVSTSTEDKSRVFRSLQQNAFLQQLYLSFIPSDEEFDENAWQGLETLLGTSCTLHSLTIFKKYGESSQQNLGRLFEIVTSNKSLRSLTLPNFHFISDEESDAFAGLIKDNTSITQLTLAGIQGIQWEKFFSTLRCNDALETLDLSWIETLDERAFKELLGTIQVNSSLNKIEFNFTNWQTEGKDAIVREALEQKARREI